jgi:hypothetical protein
MFREVQKISALNYTTADITCYRGKEQKPRWMDIDEGRHAKLNYMTMLLSAITGRVLFNSVHSPRRHLARGEDQADRTQRGILHHAIRNRIVLWQDGAHGVYKMDGKRMLASLS